MDGIEAFEEVRRLIVVAAHPDDLETICGGTISLLIQRGVKVFSVNCTLGDIGSQDADITRPALATTRLAETKVSSTFCARFSLIQRKDPVFWPSKAENTSLSDFRVQVINSPSKVA